MRAGPRPWISSFPPRAQDGIFPSVSLPQRLKTETRPHHERAEAAVRLLEPGLTLDGYRRHLEALYGFHQPVEERLGAVLTEALPALHLRERLKRPWLEADLRALGHDAASLARLPRCPEPPSLPSLPEALGGCYVLEGATLGGQLILRHLRRHFEGAPAGDFVFFRAYGDDVGPKWRGFAEVLTRAAEDSSEPHFEDRVVRGAQDTFDAFEHWLRRALG
ncbi:biliverdin-producing heme oxygenase [Myxococcus sp. K38C18041901]|uniref:biliverdin-producing heme oxygenase n=1 Tax=Myxococcus guangdongensis TaxID=2906760 RepID=UPI0020A75E63|nr:biliverdin-producing heme oxygenase [Myxococcus guangdongensis]MCP3058600.1 biliverdin-producing heme oxygenase [Myxococcus guangdongensis]